MPPQHSLAERDVISARDLAGLPLIGLERGTRLGEAVRDSFREADAEFQPTVEVRYCNTACVLAATGVGVAVVDPFSPRQGGHDLVVRPFTPSTKVSAYVLWSEARPLSNLAKTFRNEVRNAASRTLTGQVDAIGPAARLRETAPSPLAGKGIAVPSTRSVG